MVRFLLGAFTGLILISAILVAWAFLFPLEPRQSAPTQAETPAPEPEAALETETPVETQAVAPLIKAESQPKPEAPAAQSAEAEAPQAQATEPETSVVESVETPLVESAEAKVEAPAAETVGAQIPEVKPLPAPELSPAQAAVARAELQAQLATTANSAQPTPLVQASASATVQNGDLTAAAKPQNASYGALWDDLMQRCYDVVGRQQPMDEAGLTVHGVDRVRYGAPDTEQKWYTTAKAFSVEVKTRKGYGGPEVLRSCVLTPNPYAKVDKRGMGKLKERFHDWWARERFAQGTVDQKYPYTLSDRHRWYGGLTRFGSAQGCPLRVEFSEITIAGDMQVTFMLSESDKEGCDVTPGSGSGPGGFVRVNRLPQSGN